MKQTIFVLTVLLVGNFQNAIAQQPPQKKEEPCQQLKDCKAAWEKARNSKETALYSGCVDVCKAVREKCSNKNEHVSPAEAHRLSCKNSLNKLEQKKANTNK
jgi:hypothetical protein